MQLCAYISSSYTTLVQMRAMKEGAEFAASQKDMERCSQYSKIAQDMDHRLQMFWNKARGYIEVTQDGERLPSFAVTSPELILLPCSAAYDFGKDSGLDTCVVMASLHAGVEAGRWSVDNPQILLTHLAVVESMRLAAALR